MILVLSENLLCSTEDRKSCRFGSMCGWVYNVNSTLLVASWSQVIRNDETLRIVFPGSLLLKERLILWRAGPGLKPCYTNEQFVGQKHSHSVSFFLTCLSLLYSPSMSFIFSSCSAVLDWDYPRSPGGKLWLLVWHTSEMHRLPFERRAQYPPVISVCKS